MVRQAGDNMPSTGGGPQYLLSTVIPMGKSMVMPCYGGDI